MSDVPWAMGLGSDDVPGGAAGPRTIIPGRHRPLHARVMISSVDQPVATSGSVGHLGQEDSPVPDIECGTLRE
jgi:hypothetical protein